MAKDIQLINSNKPIRNYGAVVNIPAPTGYHVLDSRLNTSLDIDDVDEKYERRFAEGEQMSRDTQYFDVEILAGDTVSESFSVRNYSFGSFEVVGPFTGIVLNFEGKMQDGNQFEIVKDSSGASLTGVAVTTGTLINMPSEVMHGDLARYVAESGQSNNCIIRTILKG